jgi:hypothetical protein
LSQSDDQWLHGKYLFGLRVFFCVSALNVFGNKKGQKINSVPPNSYSST